MERFLHMDKLDVERLILWSVCLKINNCKELYPDVLDMYSKLSVIPRRNSFYSDVPSSKSTTSKSMTCLEILRPNLNWNKVLRKVSLSKISFRKRPKPSTSWCKIWPKETKTEQLDRPSWTKIPLVRIYCLLCIWNRPQETTMTRNMWLVVWIWSIWLVVSVLVKLEQSGTD